MRGGNSSWNYRNPCLTMHQPWASLLVHGIKRIEGRSWPSPIRGMQSYNFFLNSVKILHDPVRLLSLIWSGSDWFFKFGFDCWDSVGKRGKKKKKKNKKKKETLVMEFFFSLIYLYSYGLYFFDVFFCWFWFWVLLNYGRVWNLWKN